MASDIGFDVELDLTQAVHRAYIYPGYANNKGYHVFDTPLWQLLDILVPNFKQDSLPQFLKTVKLTAHLSHENVHLLKCCQHRDRKQVAPGMVYKVVISSQNGNSNPQNNKSNNYN